MVDKPDTGNEYIYGGGSDPAARATATTISGCAAISRRFWCAPFPSAIWPTKYEDFGVPELLHNAGTGEGIGDALGWVGAVGSAPGIVADLWVEVWWFAIAAMAILGWVVRRGLEKRCDCVAAHGPASMS